MISNKPRMRLRLRELREQQKLTLEQMAERLPYSVSQLSRWESGKSNIPSERLPELAQAYGAKTVAELFEAAAVAPASIGQHVLLSVALPSEADLTAMLSIFLEEAANNVPRDEWASFLASVLPRGLELLARLPAIQGNQAAIEAAVRDAVGRDGFPTTED